ncbi:MAG: hypothetical protein LBE10_05290 [Treponema sp.]|nr:hypothetical protein [Treponema sp.]
MGNLTVLLSGTSAGGNPGGSRSVLPDDFIGSLKYRLTFSGAAETITRDASGTASVSLEEGTWTIEAKAYAPGDTAYATVVGTGSETVTIRAGEHQSVTIKMYTDPAYEAGLTDIYIRSEAELRRIGTDFAIDGSKRFHLERDIVLTQPWTPIGPDSTNPFKAEFYGNGHRIIISGFADYSAGYLGLFGYTDRAKVENLKVHCNLGTTPMRNPSVSTPFDPLELTGTTTNIYVGALAGYAYNGSVFDKISVSGSLVFTSDENVSLYLGGIAGENHNDSVIRSSHVRADIRGEMNTGRVIVGGVAGGNHSRTGGGGGIIEKSSFAGLAYGFGSTEGFIGGIVGEMFTGAIRDCYASGNVGAGGDSVTVGGIAGRSNSIERSYAWTKVDAGGESEVRAGGIAGDIIGDDDLLSQCYALGTVAGGAVTAYIGGIVGYHSQEPIEYCAALNDIEGYYSSGISLHGIAGYAVWTPTFRSNFSAADMRITGPSQTPDPDLDGDNTTYARAHFKGPSPGAVYGPGSTSLNWNFDAGGNWKFISGYDYPVLSWQKSPPPDLDDLLAYPEIPESGE